MQNAPYSQILCIGEDTYLDPNWLVTFWGIKKALRKAIMLIPLLVRWSWQWPRSTFNNPENNLKIAQNQPPSSPVLIILFYILILKLIQINEIKEEEEERNC